MAERRPKKREAMWVRYRRLWLAAKKGLRQQGWTIRQLERVIEKDREAHAADIVRLKDELLAAKFYGDRRNEEIAQEAWDGPVKSPIDGKIYETPEEYAAHLTANGKQFM